MDQSRRQIFVVAGNHSEFMHILKKKHEEFFFASIEETFPNYIYVSHVDILKGRSEIEGFYCGTYWTRQDLHDIKFVIDVIKARMNATV